MSLIEIKSEKQKLPSLVFIPSKWQLHIPHSDRILTIQSVVDNTKM